jgi:hypothetical protein
MLRSIFVFLGAMVLAASTWGAEPEHSSALSKKISVPSNLGFSFNVSPDSQAATILFDNLIVDIGPASQGARTTQNQTAIQTKLATIHVPYTTGQRSVTMNMDLRGFAHVDSGGTARLVACVGDKTQVLKLSADKANKVELKGNCKCVLAEERPDVIFDDWTNRVTFTVQVCAAKPVLQITLFLLVEHDTDADGGGGGALLAVDSLDLEIAKSNKAAIKQ